MSITVRTAALAALEAGVNRALSLDPASRKALDALNDSVFLIDCTEPETSVYLHIGEEIRISSVYDGDTVTAIRGTANDFLELLLSDDPASTLINGGIALQGSSAPLLELQKVLRQLDVDWEAPIAELFGDVVAHHIGRRVRSLGRWGKEAAPRLQRQLQEYIFEEGRLSPGRDEYEDFLGGLSNLTNDIDRLEARIARLRQRLPQQ